MRLSTSLSFFGGLGPRFFDFLADFVPASPSVVVPRVVGSKVASGSSRSVIYFFGLGPLFLPLDLPSASVPSASVSLSFLARTRFLGVGLPSASVPPSVS